MSCHAISRNMEIVSYSFSSDDTYKWIFRSLASYFLIRETIFVKYKTLESNTEKSKIIKSE